MFLPVLQNVLVMLGYMSIAFILCKGGKCDPRHAKSLSGLLLYALGPCMIINSFLKLEYDARTLAKIGAFFGVTLAIQIAFFLLLYLLLHKRYEDAKYRILSTAAVLGNVGFLGIPLITTVFPNEPIVTCYSSVYVMSMNLLVYTMGVFLITGDKKYMSLKSALLNPTSIALFISLPLFILRVNLPDALEGMVEVMAKSVTAVCMFILGMRLSTVPLKKLVTRPFVYATCSLKLVLYPLFAYLCVAFLPCFSDVFKVSIFVLSATPSGAIILSLAELHECEQELAANVVLLTTILSVLTIPLMVLLVL